MSASNFLTVGKLSINLAGVTYAEWVTDKTVPDPLAGFLHVSTGLRTFVFPFSDEGVPEAAAQLGLGEHAAEHAKAVKAKEKATKDAEHAAEKTAEKAAKDAEEAAKPEPHKAAHAHTAHKAHG